MRERSPISVLALLHSLSLRVGACSAVGFLGLAFTGCATWNNPGRDTETAVSRVPSETVRHHPQSILLRSRFFSIALPEPTDSSTASDSFATDPWQDLWRSVDETAINHAVRRRLIDNGLRLGVVNNVQRLKDDLAALQPAIDVIDEFMRQADVADEVAGLDSTEPMRLGGRYELPLRHPVAGRHVTLARLGGETVGRTLSEPQPVLTISPQAGPMHGQVRLNLRPEIQHGEMRKSFTTSRAAVRMEQRRESWAFDELQWTIHLGEGDVLMVAPTREPRGIGRGMLMHAGEGGEKRRTVLLLSVDHLPGAEDAL